MNTLIPMEFKKQRIMTTKVLAEQFGATEKNINDNFANNKDRFKEGKHFIKLEGQALKEFKSSLPDIIGEPLKFAPKLILWTDRGAARHAKILDTDEAWEVYEELEENYFNPVRVKRLSPQEMLELQFNFTKEVKAEVDELKEDFNNLPLLGVDCEEITKLIKKKCTSITGYKTPAYKDKSLRGKVYTDIYQQLKREFDISSYKAIKRNQLELAKEIINNYKVPMALKEKIYLANGL